jgi:uncharacterized protein YndB with AHSA1/START domain
VAKKGKKKGRAKKAARTKKARARGPKRGEPKKANKANKANKASKANKPARRPSRRAGPVIPPGPTELDTIKLAYLFRETPPAAIYRAMIDAGEHSRFTGYHSEIDPRVGGGFSLFGGFIHGMMQELVPDARIVQTWRSNHFPKNNPDSTVEVTLTPVPEGTRLELRHIGVPKEQVPFLADGWLKYSLHPLAKHLGKRMSVRPPAP